MLERLDHANHALGANTIATLLIAYLDVEQDGSHTLHWSNAGHPAPTVLTEDGQVIALPGTDTDRHNERPCSALAPTRSSLIRWPPWLRSSSTYRRGIREKGRTRQ